MPGGSLTALKAHILRRGRSHDLTSGRPDLPAVYISCDPQGSAPSGTWTEASGGNGCDDGVRATSIGAPGGNLTSVRIEHTWQPITPIIGSLIGPITLSGSASMTINEETPSMR